MTPLGHIFLSDTALTSPFPIFSNPECQAKKVPSKHLCCYVIGLTRPVFELPVLSAQEVGAFTDSATVSCVIRNVKAFNLALSEL